MVEIAILPNATAIPVACSSKHESNYDCLIKKKNFKSTYTSLNSCLYKIPAT